MTIFLSFVLLAPACKNDDETPADLCANITCQNGGTCADGSRLLVKNYRPSLPHLVQAPDHATLPLAKATRNVMA